MLYVRDTFQFTQLPNPPEGLELLPIILHHNNISYNSQILYLYFLSTSQLYPWFTGWYLYLFRFNWQCSVYKPCNCWWFQCRHVNLYTSCVPKNQQHNGYIYGLSQMVTEFTHVHHNSTKSIIDLLFVSDPQLVRSCFTIPALSKSRLITTVWKLN